MQVLYHSPCFDGLWACLPVYLYHRNDPGVQFRFLPFSQATRELHTFTPARVTYFLDTTGTADLLAAAVQQSAAVVVIDHHYRALDCVPATVTVVHSPHKSACVLSWDYFCAKRCPLTGDRAADDGICRVLACVQDRDLYALRLPETAEVLAGLAEV